ncbi:hypothetical protein [Paraburkholderia sp. JPY419]|uniref:hypothetical protein n=1 Tax=Paraburkholderia sp. JPY419 TaxID=667660 RepID=UPI003D1BFF2C
MKTDAQLRIDADAPLPAALASQGFEPVLGGACKFAMELAASIISSLRCASAWIECGNVCTNLPWKILAVALSANVVIIESYNALR